MDKTIVTAADIRRPGVPVIPRNEETPEETALRFLGRYGVAGLRAMAAEYRTYQRHGAPGYRLPLRYGVAASCLESLIDAGIVKGA